ncbi:protoporphyrinogen/coproporphyrinogen oxidase [Microbacterium aurum]
MTDVALPGRAGVVVIGGGIAGLAVAHDLARAGVDVVVGEAGDRVGGLLRRGLVGGVAVDLGAESFATRTDAVPALIADAGFDLDVCAPRPGGAHLAVATGDGPVRAPLPRRAIIGIPADPLAPDVVAIIGPDAAARAAAEPDLPLSGAADPSLHALVAERCGAVVAERLVDPLCRSVYSRPAADARLSELHPALWRAFVAHGSLLRAVAALASDTRAGAAVGGIAGGMWRLPEALAAAAQAHGAWVRTGAAVTAIGGDAASGFVVRTAAGDVAAADVVIATGAAAAERLLVPDASAATRPAPVRVVAAAIDHHGLDGFPVGSGVIVDPALPTAAKALTHTTAKWPWLGGLAPTGRHIVRLSARHADGRGLADAADVAREVALLTGVAITAADVVDVVVQEWTDAVAPASVAASASAAAGRGIHVTGAAVAGTGLASVIPHARALAARLAPPASASASPLAAASERRTA